MKKGFVTRRQGVFRPTVRVFSASGRGIFAVVGRETSLFSGLAIGPKSSLCFTLIACNFQFMPHTAARCCNKQQQKTPRAKQYTSLALTESSMWSITRQPRNRRLISQVEKEASLARKYKIEHQNVYRWHNHHPPATATTTTYTTASNNIIIGWNLYEYVG